MLILFQLILFCLLFTLMVKLAVGNNAINGLYFYPKPVQERAYEIALTDRETVARKRKRFMIPFFLVMLAALLLIIGIWNRVSDFKTAALGRPQQLLAPARLRGHSLCTDLAASAEKADDPDADLDRRRGRRCGYRRPAVLREELFV